MINEGKSQNIESTLPSRIRNSDIIVKYVDEKLQEMRYKIPVLDKLSATPTII